MINNKIKDSVIFDESKAVISLRGIIGEDLNGHYLAEAIDYLTKEGVEEIEISINSEGGSVFQGLSVVNSILKSSANVTTSIDGIAASMAGVIAMAGDNVRIVDYGQLMVHDPHFGRKPSNNKERNALNAIKSTLVKIFENRGVNADIDEMMRKETWIDAKKAKELNLVDEVYNTGKVVDLLSFENLAQMVACAENVATDKVKHKTQIMEDVFNYFGLSEDAKQNDVLNKIKEVENAKKESEGKVLELENALKLANEKRASLVIENLIKEGKFSEDKKEELINSFISNEEVFNAITGAVKTVEEPKNATASVLNEINIKKESKKEVNLKPKNEAEVIEILNKYGENSEEYKNAFNYFINL